MLNIFSKIKGGNKKEKKEKQPKSKKNKKTRFKDQNIENVIPVDTDGCENINVDDEKEHKHN